MMVNFWRTRELTHAVVPAMRERQWGRIVNLTGSSEPPHISAAAPAKPATPLSDPTYTLPFTMVGTMNLFPLPK